MQSASYHANQTIPSSVFQSSIVLVYAILSRVPTGEELITRRTCISFQTSFDIGLREIESLLHSVPNVCIETVESGDLPITGLVEHCERFVLEYMVIWVVT